MCDPCSFPGATASPRSAPRTARESQVFSEMPFMRDASHWGVLTIGTGLGNAHFTNLTAAGED